MNGHNDSNPGRTALQLVLGDERYIPYFPVMAHALGSPGAAVFLTYLARWEKYSEGGEVYRTKEEIQEDTALTIEMQRRIVPHLEDLEVLKTRRGGIPARLFYRIRWDNLESRLKSWGNPISRVGERPTLSNRSTNKSPSNEGGQEPSGRFPETSPKDLIQSVYDRLLEDGIRLTSEDFKFHLGRAKEMLQKDSPTPEEIQALPDAFADLYAVVPNPDVVKALRDLRRGALKERQEEERRRERLAKRRKAAEEMASAPPWEQMNPHSEEAQKARDKPRRVEWYLATYPEEDLDSVEALIQGGLTHTQIIARIEEGE